MDYLPNRSILAQSELDVSHALDRASSELLNQNKMGKRKNYIKRQLADGLESIMLYKTQVLVNNINHITKLLDRVKKKSSS